MVRESPATLQHRTVGYGRSFLERQQDLGEQAQIFPAVDVGMREGLRELERAGETPALFRDAETGRRRGVAIAGVVLPRGADIVETVDGDALEQSGCLQQLPAQFHFRADALIARDFGDLVAATQPLAADLEAFVVGNASALC